METSIRVNTEVQRLLNVINVKINRLEKGGINVQSLEAQNNELITENDILRTKITLAKESLVKTAIENGKKQVPLPETRGSHAKIEIKKEPEHRKEVEKAMLKNDPNAVIKPICDKKTYSGDSDIIDASKLNMRVGKILEVSRHADADSLYVELVDVGEDKPRQIISGLVKYCTESELQGRLGVFLLNLKPAKMRGVLSEGMIMCASAPDLGKVEPIQVPEGVKPGDRVTVEGFDGVPDEVLNPKKKIFELIKPDLRVNANGQATYKGARWQVNGQVGSIVATTLTDVQIS